MRSNLPPLTLILLLATSLAGCHDDPASPPIGDHSLTVEGDQTFQQEHAGERFTVFVQDVEGDPGDLVASASDIVSGSGDHAFALSFEEVLEEQEDYRVLLWIDAADGGTEGICDPDDDLVQAVEITGVEQDEQVTLSRDPDDDASCETFSFSLDFSGDASFQGAHGDQVVRAAVVHAGLDVVVAEGEATVASEGEVSFTFSFEDILTLGSSYRVDYWIDSNFDDGTTGTCDEPSDDHQWRLDGEDDDALVAVTEDVVLEDGHRLEEVEDVCDTFEGDA